LQEIERIISVTEIRKWEFIDAVTTVAVLWNSVSSIVIHNCFTKGGCSIEKSVSKDESGMRVTEESNRELPR
jgi:hypothetical protein